jgi:cytochrome P450
MKSMTAMEYDKVFALEDEALECPYEHFKQARSQCPVSRSEGSGFWVASDHEHVTAVLKDPATFSSSSVLGPQVSAEWQRMIDLAAATSQGKREIGEDYGSSDRKVLQFCDPPEHTRHRKLITSALSPAAIRSWEPRIRETAQLYIDGLAKQPAVDFVKDFATGYTMTVIADILGVPRDQVDQLLAWAEGFNSMVGNPHQSQEEIDALVHVRLGFDLYFDQAMKARRQEPTGDLVSRIVELNDAAEEPLERDELFQVLQLVVVGGSDTSSTALAKMVEHLALHPEQWTELREDPSRIPAFMEEMLRTEAPVQGIFRHVTRDTELGGQPLKEGDYIWVSIGSANRDPEVFQDPDTQDISRKGTPSKYVSFGAGPHTCPGTALTRLELRVMLEMLTSRFTGVRLLDGKPASKKSFLFFGPAELHVEFTS